LIKETKELDDYEYEFELLKKTIDDFEYEFQLPKKRLADASAQLSEKTIAKDECSIAGSRLETHQWTSSSSVHGARNEDEDVH
jgi:hypothetical protein